MTEENDDPGCDQAPHDVPPNGPANLPDNPMAAIRAQIEGALAGMPGIGANDSPKPADGSSDPSTGGTGEAHLKSRRRGKVKPPGEAALGGAGRVWIKRRAGNLIEEIDLAVATLAVEPAALYRFGKKLVQPEIIEIKGVGGAVLSPGLKSVNEIAIGAELARRSRWFTFDKRAEDWLEKNPPKDVCEHIIARGASAALPGISGVIAGPTMRPNGTVISTAGFDHATGLYYLAKKPLDMTPVPESPSRGEADEALGDLQFLLSGFPFVNDTDRAVALSLLTTAVLRPGFDLAPLHAVTAPSAGTGKSHLIHVAAALAIGKPAPMLTVSGDPAENEKRLVAALLSGMPLVALDNLNTPLSSDTLAQAVEQPFIKIRPLGTSEDVEIPARALFAATGNGLQIAGDNLRRCLVCRLDAGVERPELRDFDFNPLEAALSDRARYVRAALILGVFGLRTDAREERPLASFGMWNNTVRRALLTLGVADPVASIETSREAAPDLSVARTILSLLHKIFDGKAFSVREVIASAMGHNSDRNIAPYENELDDDRLAELHDASRLDKARRAELREGLLSVAGAGGAINSKRLSRWFSRHQGKIVGGCTIATADRDPVNDVSRFKVIAKTA